MEKEKTFVAKLPEEPKKPRQYELQEIQGDISLFPKKVRPLVEECLAGETSRWKPKEVGLFNAAKKIWWQDKYGFPYNNKIGREELLRRKYAPPKELTEQQKFQLELFTVFRDKNMAEIARFRKLYEEKYPDQLEGVAVLFGLVPFFEAQQRLDRHKIHGWDEEAMREVRDCTEYQFLLSDFVWHNGHGKEFLSVFWEALEGLAKESGFLKQMHQLRRSILSSVALIKAFEAIGKNPMLSHPKEDAFQAIDLWLDSESAVQVKGAHLRDEPLSIVEADTVSFPAVAVEEGGEGKLFSSHFSLKAQKFRVKVQEYGAMIGKSLRGYFAVVPYEKFDFFTGESDSEIIEKIRSALQPK